MTPERRALIQGFRDFADWLEANPDVPIADFQWLQYDVALHEDVADDAAGAARVRQVADLIGAPFRESGGTHFSTEWNFGPLTWRVSYIARAHMEAYSRHTAQFYAQFYERQRPVDEPEDGGS